MNQYFSTEEMDRRIREIALESAISECNNGIEALRKYRARLRAELKILNEKVKQT